MNRRRIARQLVKLARELEGGRSSYPSLPKGKDKDSGVYVDYDEELDIWCVFGLDSGFCYSTHASEDQAERAAKKFEYDMGF